MSKDYDEERESNRERGRLLGWLIRTRVPSKYRLVDLETGDVWMHPDAQNRHRGWVSEDVRKELE